MNEKLEQCAERLKSEIQVAESCIESAGRHASAAAEHDVNALELRMKEVLAKCDAKRELAVQAGHRIRDFIEETKSMAVSKFEEWRTNREIGMIEKDADRKEQHAVDALVLAAFAILEAEAAIVDALKARKIAIEVAG